MERIIFYYESIKPDRTAARNNPTIKNSVINTRNNKVHVLNSKGKSTSISANGNMIIDKNKGITNIEYNHLNLPKKIEFASDNPMGSNKINYTFDATGVKLAKSVIDNAGFYTATTTTPAGPRMSGTRYPLMPLVCAPAKLYLVASEIGKSRSRHAIAW